MSLVRFFQENANSFLSAVADVFNFLSSFPVLVILFAIVFLLISKEDSFKLGLSYAASFLLGGVVLKNIVARPRPYMVDSTILAQRFGSSFGSMPSLTAMNVSGVATYSILKTRETKKTKWVILSSFFLFCVFVAFSKIYLAQNYLLDMLVGFVLGFIIFYLVFKFIKIREKDYKWYLFGVVIPLGIMFIFINQWFQNDGNIRVFEYSGFIISFLLFSYIEQRFIKYQIKNNLIFSSFKLCITVLVLCLYFFLYDKLLHGVVIFAFVKYFLANVIILVVLPLLFKVFEKYFYVFSNQVDSKRVVLSKISLSLKATKKIAKKFASQLHSGDIVVLSGDLGAGKSVFTRDILQEFGVEGKITSPTFTLLNEYKISNGQHYYHFDMYRLNDEQEAENIGLEEILDDNSSIKFIEWADRVQSYLPEHYKKVTIVKLGKNSRNIIVEEI